VFDSETLNSLDHEERLCIGTSLHPYHFADRAVPEEILFSCLTCIYSIIFLLLSTIQTSVIDQLLAVVA
jgi:hypothetical protein